MKLIKIPNFGNLDHTTFVLAFKEVKSQFPQVENYIYTTEVITLYLADHTHEDTLALIFMKLGAYLLLSMVTNHPGINSLLDGKS
jgi:hypothetical protein